MTQKKRFLNRIEGHLILVILIPGMLISCSQMKSESTGIPEDLSIVKIPAVSGPFTIDGKLDDMSWQSALTLSLKNKDNSLIEEGGNTKIAVRGRYLCMSAQLPESGKVIVHSAGSNPSWWREDMIIWMIRYRSTSPPSNRVALLVVNPLGAYKLGSVRDIYNLTQDDIITSTPFEWSDEIMVAAEIGEDEWRVEAALPLERLANSGFLSVERIRVPRVNTPESRFFWPGPNEQVVFELAESNTESSPMIQKPDFPENNIDTSAAFPVNKLAAELKALTKEAWSDKEHESLGVRNMLEKSIRAHMTALAEEEKLAWQQVKTIDDWEQFRDKRLKSFLNFIGSMPDRTPLKPEITRRSDYGKGFVIENIVFESQPGLVVTANLYLPDKITGKIPAIVVVHSHHAPKTQTELQDMGMTWARSGTAVLVMDQHCAGERIQTQPWSREGYYGRYALGNQLYLAGESLVKWMVWDIMRGIDLLTERSYIDPKRIVLMGAVAGGGDPAALAAVIDPRIAAVIPFNFGEAGPEEHYNEPRRYEFETADPEWAYWETTRSLPKSVSEQFLDWFLCASIAPRNFIFSFEIGWPKTVEEEPAWVRYKKVYNFYGALDNLASVDGLGPFPGPGECSNVGTFLRNRIYPILNKWLDMPVPETEYHKVLPESELMCLTPSSVAERKLKPASLIALEQVNQHLTSSRSKYNELSVDERINTLRQDLKQKLGYIEPEDDPSVHELWSKQSSDFSMAAFHVESEPGITLPFFLLTPKDNSNRRPVVIALAEGGKEGFLTQRPNEIAILLGKGITVCLPDLRGSGEVAGSGSRGPGAMDLAGNELMLGGTMTGSRLKDTRNLLHWLAKRSDIDPNNIAIWGDSFSAPNAPDFQFDQSPGQQPGPVQQRQAEPLGPFLAVLAALYEENVKAIACRGGLISFSSVLEDNFCHIPQDVVVPGLLKVTDISDIVRSIASRPVLIAEPVNGLNKKVSLSLMEKEYGTEVPNITLSEEIKDQFLAVWIANQCLKKEQ